MIVKELLAQVQPVDGGYFRSEYFVVSTCVSLVVAAIGATFGDDLLRWGKHPRRKKVLDHDVNSLL